MKKKKQCLMIEKFKIAKLNNLRFITGGDSDTGNHGGSQTEVDKLGSSLLCALTIKAQ